MKESKRWISFKKFLKIIFIPLLICLYFFVSNRYKILPEESKVIENLKSVNYEITTNTEVDKDYLEILLNKIVNYCSEGEANLLIHSAFNFEFKYAYEAYDDIDKIIIAQRHRIRETITINEQTPIVNEYFNTGIVVFYFDSAESASSFYSNCKNVFDAISVYYERTIYNLFDEKVVYDINENVVYIGSDTSYACARY